MFDNHLALPAGGLVGPKAVLVHHADIGINAD